MSSMSLVPICEGIAQPSPWADVARNLNQDVQLKIAKNLMGKDLDAMKFLTTDSATQGDLEKILSVTDFLDYLHQQYDLPCLLPQLLYRIRRFDILKECLDLTKEEVKRRIAESQYIFITPYRILLYDISEELVRESFSDLKFLCKSQLTGRDLDSATCGFKLFRALENVGQLSDSNLQFLISILGNRVPLIRKCRLYEARRDQRLEPAPNPANANIDNNVTASVACTDDSIPPSIRDSSSQPPSSNSSINQDSDPVSQQQLMQEVESLRDQLQKVLIDNQSHMQETYLMSNSPRGHCLVLNYQTFQKRQNRKGSEFDAAALNEVFKDLDFTVNVVDNPTYAYTEELMEKYSSKIDHSDFDCLVICVLSHGREGHFYCCDDAQDNSFNINLDFIRYFSANRCPSLAGKPKLFFIQACQGISKMSSAPVPDEDLVADGDTPDMSDMVIACATFPGHVAFRSISKGSWFIGALCDVLNARAANMHLVDMLIEVNNRVAKEKVKQSQSFYKQMPAPRITLRKAVWFRPRNAQPGDDE